MFNSHPKNRGDTERQTAGRLPPDVGIGGEVGKKEYWKEKQRTRDDGEHTTPARVLPQG